MISYLLAIRQKHVVISFTAMRAYFMRSRTEFGVLKWESMGSKLHVSIMVRSDEISCELHHEKNCPRGFRPGPTQTGLYSQRRSIAIVMKVWI